MLHGRDIQIFQLTDHATEAVPGVDQVLRGDLSQHIMVARLQASCLLDMVEDYTFFCDADSVLVSPLNIAPAQDILLSPRVVDFPINAHYPEHYPEFEGKMISEVMPFLFGAMAVRRNSDFFRLLLEICEQLPDRFKRWYGDQVALAIAAHEKRFQYGLLNPDIHLNIVREAPSVADLEALRSAGTQLITFKGPASNKESNLPMTLLHLLQVLNK